MNLSETIRAKVELPCSIRLSGADLRTARGVTEELARESLIVVVPSVALDSWLKAGAKVFIAVELPCTGTFRPRVLECAAAVSRLRPLISGVRIITEVQRMTVINRDPETRIGSRPAAPLRAAETVSAIAGSQNLQPVIRENRLTNPNWNPTGENTMSFLKNFFIEEDGQSMVEYGLILGLVVMAAIAAFNTFGADLIAGIGSQSGKIVTNVK